VVVRGLGYRAICLNGFLNEGVNAGGGGGEIKED